MGSIKKVFALLIPILMVLCIGVPVPAVAEEALQKAVWAGATSACFRDSAPDDSTSAAIDLEAIRIGGIDTGGDAFAFLHLPMGSEYFPDEITEAKLFLKVAEGEPPGHILIGAVNEDWFPNSPAYAQAKAIIDKDSLATVAVTPEEDGWISLSVTGFVQAWLRCDMQNAGFALLGLEGERQGAFVSESAGENAPYLEISATMGKRPSGYGKFAYTRMPVGDLSGHSGANCFAFAIRENIGIYFADIGGDYHELARIYGESGEDGVAEYVAGLHADYVEAHQTELRITKFRRIDDFDSEIDPATEYRIAFRVTCDGSLGLPMDAFTEIFDYHFWAQLDDGRWAQKFTYVYSEIVPCTGPGISPGKYNWNAGVWSGMGSTYTSKVIYYAVTKDADEFTTYMQFPFTDVDIGEYFTYVTIQYILNNDLMTGTDPTLFSPDMATTRGVAINAFYRMAGSPDAGALDNPFDDVSGDAPYVDAVKWAAANGIITVDVKFSPDEPITREEVAAAFYGYEQLTGEVPPDVYLEVEFSDAADISDWARDAAKTLAKQRIIRFGGADESFSPKGEVTRMEFATMLFDFHDAMK